MFATQIFILEHYCSVSDAEAPSRAGYLAKPKNPCSACGSSCLLRQSISRNDPFSGAGSNARVATQPRIEK